MARQVQVSKMGKRYRKAGYKAGASIVKRRATREAEANYRSYLPKVRRPDFGFPDKTVTRVRYCDVYDLFAAAGTVANQVMRLNGLNDPDFSGVGHQPMWYDQWCGPVGSAPYGRYRVLGSKITVKFASANTPAILANNWYPAMVGIVAQNVSGLFAASSSALMETSNCNWKLLQDKSGGNNVITISNTYSPSRDLGLDSGDDSISAAYNANPTQQFYAHVFKLDTVGGGTVKAYVEVEYLAEFFDRNEVAQS